MRDLRTIGKAFSADIEVYSECKYHMGADVESRRISYDGIISWEIVTGEDAEQIEAETDGSCIDDYHEYLVLHFENGETSTFRNSYVDMFRI